MKNTDHLEVEIKDGKIKDGKIIIQKVDDYSNSKIYKIVSSHTDKVYIGSTNCSLKIRFRQHKSYYKRYIEGVCRYYTACDILKYTDASIILLQSVNAASKVDLLRLEASWINELDCVNKFIPNRSHAEWQKDNRERQNKYQAQWRLKQKLIKQQQQKIDLSEITIDVDLTDESSDMSIL